MNNLRDNQYFLHLLEKYKINDNEKDYIVSIIEPIFLHEEFQKRMTDEFSHHDKITLGQHILEVTIKSFILHKKHKSKARIDLVLKIAMLHDLYTSPYQNNPDGVNYRFFNKHGFRHPIEAVINAYTWYPELFASIDDANILIDGIIHHMFPFPVHIFIDDENNLLELNNFSSIKNIDKNVKNIIIQTSNKYRLGNICFCISTFKEGRIVSIADKIVTYYNLKNVNFEGIKSLITGKNKNLKK